MNSIDDEPLPERPSKSQRKREMHQLQALGERLVELNQEQIAGIPLGTELLQALEEMRRIKGREARRRQLQYIGKLMRHEDGNAIAAALERLRAGGIEQTRRLHQLERWRDRLIEQGDGALGELIAAHPGADRQQIRQLVRGARREQELHKPPAASRKLFRYLRAIMAAE
jgi:ribosome-associated protein